MPSVRFLSHLLADAEALVSRQIEPLVEIDARGFLEVLTHDDHTFDSWADS
jgi:hypothetical protein